MKKILIADDHPQAVELVRVTLEGGDYKIVNTSNGEETLKKARLEKPDLILLDVVMPKIDGFEVCRKLKKDPQTQEIPILMLTAKAQQVDKEKGKQVGARDYITKPFSPSALLVKIEEVLA
ncbi:Alkaline phosphatase synthesis transcriptional regulatory protein PhoP [subsurface metagenome]